MTDQTAKPITGPGRDPPDRITLSCFHYIARAMDLFNFSSFFFGIIAHSDQFAHGLKDESKQRFEGAAAIYKAPSNNDPKDYSIARQFMNEMITSRAVETFNLYITMILRELFHTKPEMLKSESTIDIATVIDNLDSIISEIVERKLHDLGYKGLSV